jgi:ketosteroid isomerase-like protein
VVVNPSVAIEAVIADYARAIGSRDIAEVRRANPGLTDTQQKGFEDFFQSVKSLRANFSVASLDVSGTTAEAHVTGAYEYSSGSKVDRQPVTFVATLRLTGGAWKLTSVR